MYIVFFGESKIHHRGIKDGSDQKLKVNVLSWLQSILAKKVSVYIVCEMIRSIARSKDERDKKVEELECGNA